MTLRLRAFALLFASLPAPLLAQQDGVLMINSASLAFPSHPIGTSSSGTLLTMVRNTDTQAHVVDIYMAPVVCLPIADNSACAAPAGWVDFTLETDCPHRPAMLAAGGACLVGASFSPRGVGDRRAEIHLYAAGVTSSIALSGVAHANLVHDEAVDGPLPSSLLGVSQPEREALTFNIVPGTHTVQGQWDGAVEAFAIRLAPSTRLERVIVEFESPVDVNGHGFSMEAAVGSCNPSNAFVDTVHAGRYEYSREIGGSVRPGLYAITLGTAVAGVEPSHYSVTFVASAQPSRFSDGFEPCEPLLDHLRVLRVEG